MPKLVCCASTIKTIVLCNSKQHYLRENYRVHDRLREHVEH